MLNIVVKPQAVTTENGSVIKLPGGQLCLEHSLLSISKWEEKTHKPFYSQDSLTAEDLLFYIKCMTINDVDSTIYLGLTNSDVNSVIEYMKDSHTATWFSESSKPSVRSSEALTSELIYYYMSQAQLPIEMERWNINRLFTVLRIAAIKSQPAKKMDRRTAAKRNAALNRARLKGRHM